MTIPLHPNLIGVLHDATNERLKSITQVAAELSNDVSGRHALQTRLIGEDLGNPTESEASVIRQALSIAVSTYSDWIERGRWLVTLDDVDDRDLTAGTHYVRLSDFPAISMGEGEDLHLEGAFVSSQENPKGRRDFAVTVLLSGDPGPRLPSMSLKELMQHQSNIVMTTWDVDAQRPIIAFCGRKELASHPETFAGIEMIWANLANRLGYGEFTPITAQLKLG